MKNNIFKLWELTSQKFFALTIISHISFLYLLVDGSYLQIVAAFAIAFVIILFSSVIVYHRYLSHRSWNCPRWYEIVASILGIFSFTGSTISRTVTHRQHHAFTDELKDPHSPFLVHWSRIYFPIFNQQKLNINLAKDLITDKLHRTIHTYYLLFVILGFLIIYCISTFNWAIALTIAPGALCWANVCILNIFGHSNIKGTNSSILSFITLGEGNHKYHHSNPTQANTGQNNFDLAYQVIKLIEKIQ